MCHTPVSKEVNRSLHTCAQDVQITYTTNYKVNSSQCYDYIITGVSLFQNDHWSEKDYIASKIIAVILSAAGVSLHMR
jgi:hypothetical protein